MAPPPVNQVLRRNAVHPLQPTPTRTAAITPFDHCFDFRAKVGGDLQAQRTLITTKTADYVDKFCRSTRPGNPSIAFADMPNLLAQKMRVELNQITQKSVISSDFDSSQTFTYGSGSSTKPLETEDILLGLKSIYDAIIDKLIASGTTVDERQAAIKDFFEALYKGDSKPKLEPSLFSRSFLIFVALDKKSRVGLQPLVFSPVPITPSSLIGPDNLVEYMRKCNVPPDQDPLIEKGEIEDPRSLYEIYLKEQGLLDQKLQTTSRQIQALTSSATPFQTTLALNQPTDAATIETYKTTIRELAVDMALSNGTLPGISTPLDNLFDFEAIISEPNIAQRDAKIQLLKDKLQAMNAVCPELSDYLPHYIKTSEMIANLSKGLAHQVPLIKLLTELVNENLVDQNVFELVLEHKMAEVEASVYEPTLEDVSFQMALLYENKESQKLSLIACERKLKKILMQCSKELLRDVSTHLNTDMVKHLSPESFHHAKRAVLWVRGQAVKFDYRERVLTVYDGYIKDHAKAVVKVLGKSTNKSTYKQDFIDLVEEFDSFIEQLAIIHNNTLTTSPEELGLGQGELDRKSASVQEAQACIRKLAYFNTPNANPVEIVCRFSMKLNGNLSKSKDDGKIIKQVNAFLKTLEEAKLRFRSDLSDKKLLTIYSRVADVFPPDSTDSDAGREAQDLHEQAIDYAESGTVGLIKLRQMAAKKLESLEVAVVGHRSLWIFRLVTKTRLEKQIEDCKLLIKTIDKYTDVGKRPKLVKRDKQDYDSRLQSPAKTWALARVLRAYSTEMKELPITQVASYSTCIKEIEDSIEVVLEQTGLSGVKDAFYESLGDID